MSRPEHRAGDPGGARPERAGVRLDKWLWAARFFKTRSLAADAIAAGKIRLNDERPKRATNVRAGDAVLVRIGPYEHRVTVRALSERRGSATVAATLYEESAESREARARVTAQMKSMPDYLRPDGGRPSKRDRRDIDRLRGRS
jgi:ribosome-associated heat shock protein Hsp15